jgi:ATP-dependent RNA helicase DDX46/PRP5
LDIDHSKIEYAPFRRNFYVEVPEIARLTREEVARTRREELDGCMVHGKGCPNPIRNWGQCGLNPKVMELITRILKFETPTPI